MFLDHSRNASNNHYAKHGGIEIKKSLTKTRSDDTTTVSEIITIMYGVIHIVYFVHCRFPYRRHTRNCVETRRQY